MNEPRLHRKHDSRPRLPSWIPAPYRSTGHAFDCRNHLWPRNGHVRGRKWWDAGRYDKGPLHAVPLAGDKPQRYIFSLQRRL